jgi:hypothetical protein
MKVRIQETEVSRQNMQGLNLEGECVSMMRRILFYFMVLLILLGCVDRPATEKILFDFESDGELDRLHWSCRALYSLSEEHATHGSTCLRMELYPSGYPGLAPILVEHDWRPYKALVFDLYNPQGKEIEITVRIDDKEKAYEYADRYNKNFRLGPGANSVEISLGSLITSGTERNLDLKNIYRFLFFMVSPPEKATVHVDYIRLLR